MSPLSELFDSFLLISLLATLPVVVLETPAFSLEVGVALLVVILNLHLLLPRLPQVLLHQHVLLRQSCIFELLSISLSLDEHLVGASLVLTAGLAQLASCVDLLVQVVFESALLLPVLNHVLLDLVESLLRAEMRLVVKRLNGSLDRLALLLLSHLVADEFYVSLVLLLTTLVLEAFHAVHVVDSRVKLIFLRFSLLLHVLNLLVVTLQR